MGESRLRISEDVSHLSGMPCGSAGTSGNSPTGQTVGDRLKGGGHMFDLTRVSTTNKRLGGTGFGCGLSLV
jgi:hypothetical protein